jgi:intracellular sulfur oxidation DsrE/DsrF family protein
MKFKFTNIIASVAAASMLIVSGLGTANADDDDRHHRSYDQECPVGSPYGNDTFASMFGSDVEAALRCNRKREKVKLVVQVNTFCRDAHDQTQAPISNILDCPTGRSYALGNIANMIKDYELTHGMKRGEDYKIVAVVHSGGGHLVRKFVGKDGDGNPIPNPFTADLTALMDKGVDFYFCLNTAAGFIKRGALTKGAISSQLIDGVKFVPAGLNAIADFQKVGYTYVQP